MRITGYYYSVDAIEESDYSDKATRTEGHNYGMIVGYAGRSASVHHNLFAHHSVRTPLSGLELMDHRNNVIYDVEQGLVWHPANMNHQRPGELFKTNLINNYFKNGPLAPKDPNAPRYYSPVIVASSAKIFASGNYFTWEAACLIFGMEPFRAE
jgi:pectate lyase